MLKKIIAIGFIFIVSVCAIIGCEAHTNIGDRLYKVTFMVDGEVYHIAESETYCIDLPVSPSKESAVFLGWYYSENDIKFDGNLPENNTEERTVAAKWSDRQYAVSYYVNKYESDDNILTQAVQYGHAYKIQSVQDLYDNLGAYHPDELDSIEWYAEPEFINKIVEIPLENAQNVKLYGKLIYKNYMITYELGGGVNSEENSESVIYDKWLNLMPATRLGYIFLGWYKDSDFSGNAYTGGYLQDDLTLYAKWQKGSGHFDYEYDGALDGYTAQLVRALETEDSNLVIADYYDGKPVVKIIQSHAVPGEFTLYIPKTIKIIAYLAFDSVNITEVTFEEGGALEEISTKAFANCPLTQIDLPSTVKIIGDMAFANTALSGQLTIEGVETMGVAVFQNVTLDHIEFKDTCSIEVFENATFMGSNIATVRLPSSVKQISIGTFNKSGFKSIYIPASVTEIAEYSFNFLDNLEELIFADDSPVSVIPQCAIYNNRKLRKLVLPKGELTVEANGVSYNDMLSVIELENEVIHIVSYSFISNLSLHLLFKHDVNLPTFQTESTEYFINYPENTVSLKGNHLFIEGGVAYSLHKVSREANILSYVGTDERLDIPASIRHESVIYPVKSVLPAAFAENKTLKTISFGESLLSIGNGAFYKCENLTTVSLPSTLTKILESAFENCAALERMSFEGAVLDSIGMNTFKNCVSLKSVDMSAFIIKTIPYSLFENCVSLKNVILPPMVEVIQGRAFYGVGISEIAFPSSITSIDGDEVFSKSNLLRIHLPESLQTMGYAAFEDCKQLESVTFAPRIRLSMIANSTFKGTEKLSSIIIPADCTYISDYAFFGSGIASLEFASQYGLRIISYMAFKDCVNLKVLKLPNTVGTLRAGAFENCPIVSMNVPVAYQNYDIFFNENQLRELTVDSFYFIKHMQSTYYFSKVKTFYINENLSVQDFSLSYKQVASDKAGYLKFIKKSV